MFLIYSFQRQSLKGLPCAAQVRRASSSNLLTLGIRREDPLRLWERRVPLTPDAVEHLIKTHGVRVLIQPCARRAYPTNEFLKAGAELHSTLRPAHIIVGIKETPLDELITSPTQDGHYNRTHIMFSHTAKGQDYNRALLARFTNTTARLIDYELLTDEDGKRVVAFGWYAGAAGAIEGLTSLAHDHLSLGVSSPFLLLPRPYQHRGLKDVIKSLRGVGKFIAEEGTPELTGPFVIAVTGNGNVSKGALHVLDHLPIKRVTIDQLHNLATDPNPDRRYVYLIHVKHQDYLRDKTGKPFDRETYYSHPGRFESTFADEVAPYISLLINGTGWRPSFPRLMSNADLEVAQRKAMQVGRARFRTIADVSCDIEGGLQFVSRSATIDDPFFIARPKDHPSDLPGIQVMSVDILPSELPLDSSKYFSSMLLPYLETLIRMEQGKPLGEQDKVNAAILERGTIVKKGKLAPKHEWLQEHLDKLNVASNDNMLKPKKRILILGSGMVAGPAVDEISKRRDVELVIGSDVLEDAKKLVRGRGGIKIVHLDVKDHDKVRQLVQEANIVISLLPVFLHPTIAKLCIEYKKHLVTASYISPEMRGLHHSASQADILLLNEIGLDPGIDHCSAVDLRDRLEAEGKDVTSFISVCGGLPGPEFSNTPLGYKFSWSPRGVLIAGLNAARFKLAGKEFNVSGNRLFDSVFTDFPLANGLALECLPNRDSYPYVATYNLGSVEALESMFRGTLRYRGFSRFMSSLSKLGVFDLSKPFALRNGWASFIPSVLQQTHELSTNTNDASSIERAISSIIPSNQLQDVMEALTWFSIIPGSDTGTTGVPPVPTTAMPALDLFALLLAHKLRYEPHERDMVFLSHELISRPRLAGPSTDGCEEIHTASLIVRGTPEYSAMALTVGLPVAFAALRILDGEVRVRGVAGPTADVGLYKSILRDLETVGLEIRESAVKRKVGRGVVAKMVVT